MAKYEVFLPAAKEGDFNLTLKVEADNWMAALKAGLKKLGEQGAQVVNLMVDVMDDNSIHVTDATSGRVFRIKELDGAPVPAPVPAAAPAPAPAPIPLTAVAPAAAPAPIPLSTVAPIAPAAPVAPASAPAEAAATLVVKAEEKPAKESKKKQKKEEKKEEKAAPRKDTADAISVEQIDRPSQPISGPIGRTMSSTQIDTLSELFERTQEVYGLDREKGLAFLLDLALEKIPAESGSIFVADFVSNDLTVGSARGPKAVELQKMKLRMPMGVGIVGFCAQEAVGVAISDTQKDPRFYRTVSEKIGYDTRSILCAPMVSGGRTFGCLEVINKKDSSHFTDAELAILGYVAHQGARYLEQTSA